MLLSSLKIDTPFRAKKCKKRKTQSMERFKGEFTYALLFWVEGECFRGGGGGGGGEQLKISELILKTLF